MIIRKTLFALVLVAPLAGCGINEIPTAEENAKAKWSEVLNQYQRRSDLIPNLVETVKGYATQEKGTLEAIVKARASATAIQATPDLVNNPEAFKKFTDAQAQLSQGLGRLIVASENYPDLKSNQQFLALQAQLEGTENRVAIARRDYIGAVQQYNLTLETFPTMLWASTFYHSKKPMETFNISDDAKKAPTVKF